jgi:predicted anti-sigma-YlaC factor YlaD
MNCEQFQAVLDDFLHRNLADDSVARNHLKGCASCRELVALLREDLVFPQVPAPAGLAEAVMARTSGKACASARESMPGYADGELAEDDADLLSGHLTGCHECRNLEATVRMLAVDLPSLAEMEPATGFAAQVLAATSEKLSLAQRFVANWQAMMHRPRIAFEASYVAAITCVLVFGLPFTGGGGGKTLEMARMQPIQTLFAADGPLASAVHETVAYAGELGVDTTNKAKEKVVDRAEGVTGWLRGYRDGLKQRWTADNPAPDQSENGSSTEETEP